MTDVVETIGSRIRRLRGEQTQAAFAARLRVRKDTIGNYERGERRPEADVLARMREELGVDINWLLTGEGVMHGTHAIEKSNLDGVQSSFTLDEELNARVVDGISRLYKELNIGLSPMDLGRLSAKMYADVVNTYDDPDERLVGLKAFLAQLRSRLLEPVVAPATNDEGKRSA